MDEQRERAVLSERFTALFRNLGWRRLAEGEDMTHAVSRLRLIAAECEIDLDDANRESALATITALGPVLEQTANSLAIVAKGGWLPWNPVVVTFSLQGSTSAHLRVAALEGKISNRSAERVLSKVRDRLRAAVPAD